MRTYSRIGALVSLASMAAMASADNSVLIREMKNATPTPPVPQPPEEWTHKQRLAQFKRDRKAARRAQLAGY